MLRISAFLLAIASLVTAQPRVDPGRVEALVEAARKQNGIPGVAVGIITKDGDFSRGYGVRNLKTGEPVNEHTAFDVGSVTKSFTALGAALLVDDGKLDWDRPVREYLPWFRMYDPAATELITMRDLLTHRSGLPRYDFLRYAVPETREELVRRLRYLPPTASFRALYQYQNLMYTAAGYLAGVLDGSSWEDLTANRIFAPLGMRDSSTRIPDLKRTGNYASPHETRDGVTQPVDFYDYQTFGVGPNGAVNSSAADLLRYLHFHLGDGTVGGKRVLSSEQLDELHSPQIVMDESTSYALGWMVDYTTGFKIVSHSGAITGFSAFAAFAPGKGEGVVVLTNFPGAAPPIGMKLMNEILRWKVPAPEHSNHSKRQEQQPPIDGPATHALNAYAGRYTHPAFGPCEVIESAGTLTLKFPAATFPLTHLRFDTFKTNPSDMEVQFQLDTKGHISGLKARLESAAPPLLFERVN